MKTTTTFAFLVASLTMAICLASVAHTAPVTFDWAAVGNQGNAADTTGFGAVADTYRISTTEVTNAQYTEFLNAVDPTGANLLGLFNPSMVFNFGGIEKTGTTDGARYITQTCRENNPVTYVSWYDSVRFINWLGNGQGAGDTETGAYTLLGFTAIPSNSLILTRNAGATYFLPSEDEWYKAAYYDPSGVYYDYATGSDTVPVSDQPGDDPSAANYFDNDGLANGFNDGYAVTGTTSFGSNPFTDVGAYTDAASPYGTYDQNGNVFEWNEAFSSNLGFRGIRGGGWSNFISSLAASTQGDSPSAGTFNLGFRVASIPEPSTLLLGAMAAVGLLMQGRV